MNIEQKNTKPAYYQFLIFRRNSICYFFYPFTQSYQHPNLFGTLYALKNIVMPFEDEEDGRFLSYSTDTYKCHFFETHTGFYFVLLTQPTPEDYSSALNDFYRKVFAKYATTQIGWNPMDPSFGDRFRKEFISWANQAQSY